MGESYCRQFRQFSISPFQVATPHQGWGALVGEKEVELDAELFVWCLICEQTEGFRGQNYWLWLLSSDDTSLNIFKGEQNHNLYLNSRQLWLHKWRRFRYDLPKIVSLLPPALWPTLFLPTHPHQTLLEIANQDYDYFRSPRAVIRAFVTCWIKGRWPQMIFAGKSNSAHLQLSVTSCCSQGKDRSS